MKIVFDKIRWKNLLQYGSAWTEIDLSGHPMTLVVGKNGSGKSTMIDALCYVLFGKPYRKITLQKLINSINTSQLVVECEFRIGIRQYKVVRGQKPNIFEIYEDGVLKNQDASSRDYQKEFEKNILQLSYKTFIQVVVVGSNLYVPFMRLDAADRRVIVDDILDLEVYTNMAKLLKANTAKLDDELDEVKDSIIQVQEKLALHQKHIDESKKDTDVILAKKQQDLSAFQSQVDDLTTQSTKVADRIKQLQGEIADADKVRKTINKLDVFNVQIEAKLDGLKKEIEFFNKNESCPRCKQTLDNKEDVIHQCQTKSGELSKGLVDLKTTLDKQTTRLEEISKTQLQINNQQSELTKLQSRISELQRYVGLVSKEITLLSTKKPVSDDTYDAMEKLTISLHELGIRKTDLTEQQAYRDASLLLLKDGGLKAKAIHDYLPIINNKINHYLSELDFFVDFQLNEEFEETILSRHRDDFTYESFSEGQKGRINLSILFSWRDVAKLKNSVDTNLLILDEVLDSSLDSDGMDDVMRLLNLLGDGNVFLISQRGDALVDKFNNVLTFKTVGTFSEMTE